MDTVQQPNDWLSAHSAATFFFSNENNKIVSFDWCKYRSRCCLILTYRSIGLFGTQAHVDKSFSTETKEIMEPPW
jgi:hypothetical protein